MILALKCGGCGFLCLSKEDDVTVEIDFLEQRIVYICPQCKKSNVIQLKGGATQKAEEARLPRLGMISG